MVAVEACDVEGRVASIVHGRQVGVGIKQGLDHDQGPGAVLRGTGHVQRSVSILQKEIRPQNNLVLSNTGVTTSAMQKFFLHEASN